MSHFSTKSFNRRRAVGGALGGAAAIAAAKSQSFAAPLLNLQEGVTLEVWGGVPPENGPQALIDAFMEANPGITINYTRYVNDDTGNTQLDTALQGGTQIDVFFTYQVSRLAQRIRAGASLDLTSFIESDTDVSAWVNETEGIYTHEEGVYHSLPTAQEMQFMFLNKRIFDDAGVAVPTEWTIDEFIELATQFSDGMSFGAYAPPSTGSLTIGQNAWYNEDGTASNFGDPAFAESYGRHREMIDNGSAFPWTDVIAQNLRAYAQTPFLTEQVAMWVNSPWSLRYVNDKEQYPHEFVTTFAPLPSFAEGQFNNQGINNWVLGGASTEHPEEVWQFIRYWLTDGSSYLLPGGKIPALMTLEQSEVVDGLLGPDADELYDKAAFEAAVFDPEIKYFTDSITTGAAEILTMLTGQEDRFLIGEIELDEFITTITEEADSIIAGAL